MADPSGENSQSKEDEYDNAQVHLTGAELKALVDNAVKAALDRQYEEYILNLGAEPYPNHPQSRKPTQNLTANHCPSLKRTMIITRPMKTVSVQKKCILMHLAPGAAPTSISYHANPETSLERKARLIV